MNHPGVITVSLLALATLQAVWWWWADDRQFTRLTLVVWAFCLALLGGYCILLQYETLSRPLKKLHERLYAQITAPRIAALGCVLLGAYAAWYIHHVWGESLIRGDYGSFVYRNALLHEIFPRLLAYNPMLNGGYLTYELLMTGSINLFLLTYPIGVLFSPEIAFKAQPLLLILLLPGALYLSGRLVAFSHAESLLSAVFALVITSIGYGGFVQILHIGTLPYVFSCELGLVLFALIYRVFVLDTGREWGIPLIILLGSVASLHPLFFLVMAPPALAIVGAGTFSWRRKALYCLLIGIGLVAINGGWIQGLLSYKLGEEVGERLDRNWLPLREWLAKLEFTFLGLPGPLVIGAGVGLRSLLRVREESAKRRLGGLLLFTIVYYASLGATGPYWMDHTVLPARFVVPLSFFLALALGPAWPSLCGLWTRMEQSRSRISYVLNAALASLGIFLCLPYLLFFMIFPTAPQKTHQLVNWLKDNVDDDGRIFIYGPDRKEFGQVSFYQMQSKRSLLGFFHGQASGHSLPWLQAIGTGLQNPETVSQYEDLYNIRYAIILGDASTNFNSDGHRQGVPFPQNGGVAGFRLVETIDNVKIYENDRASNYFLVGEGHVKQYFDRISVTANPSDFVVLKFFWFPGLRTEPPLIVEPYRVGSGQDFIKIHTRNQQRFEILYR